MFFKQEKGSMCVYWRHTASLIISNKGSGAQKKGHAHRHAHSKYNRCISLSVNRDDGRHHRSPRHRPSDRG